MNKVTIQTVADAANVSIKTVSRVLNKEDSVRDSTRDKVLTVIAKLGYEPSPAARALASNSSKIIALIYDNPSAAYITDVQSGALKACYKNEYSLVIHPCSYKSKGLAEELITLVQRSRLDGLILTPPLTDDESLKDALYAKEITFACIAPEHTSSNYSSVSCNDSVIGGKITDYLVWTGHKNVGFIAGQVDHGAAKQRFIGYQKALSAANIELRDEFIVQGDFSYESGLEAGKQLLGLSNPPTAIFAANDYMAAGALRAAFLMGVKVPDELAIVGFDDAPVSRQIWPSLSTVKQPVQQMSEAAANLLIAKIKDPKKLNEHHVFNAELIIREST